MSKNNTQQSNEQWDRHDVFEFLKDNLCALSFEQTLQIVEEHFVREGEVELEDDGTVKVKRSEIT